MFGFKWNGFNKLMVRPCYYVRDNVMKSITNHLWKSCQVPSTPYSIKSFYIKQSYVSIALFAAAIDFHSSCAALFSVSTQDSMLLAREKESFVASF